MIENHRTGLLWKLFMGDTRGPGGPARARLHEPASRRARSPHRRTDGVARALDRAPIPPSARRNAAQRLRRSDIVKERPGFGQVIRPLRGSIVASPVPGAYDPAPDYFFHWYRDSALVVDALRLLAVDGDSGIDARGRLGRLRGLQPRLQRARGAVLPRRALARARSRRISRNLRGRCGAHVAARRRGRRRHPRQSRRHAGHLPLAAAAARRARPARARRAALAGCGRLGCRSGGVRRRAAALRPRFVRRHWREPCYDIWEEQLGRHYYTLRLAPPRWTAARIGLSGTTPGRRRRAAAGPRAAALAADSAHARGPRAFGWRPSDTTVRGYWPPAAPAQGARFRGDSRRDTRAGRRRPAHAVRDPRMHATLARLEELFDASYPINRARGPAAGPAMGRYADDGIIRAARIIFRRWAPPNSFSRQRRRRGRRAPHRARRHLPRTVRAFTPQDGGLSEQFDQNTGEPRSARHLAWSYAAFISCVAARRAALRAL